MSVTGGIMAGVGLAGSIGQGIIGSNAAQNAAGVQVSAGEQAQQVAENNQNSAINYEENAVNQNEAQLAPWITGGTESLTNLETLLGLGGNTNAPGYGSLKEGFTAPTLQQAEQQPGYQFTLGQGEGAIENSAAAKGGLISGNSLEALNNFAQNSATTDYNNVYNQSFNTFETNQQNAFQRLMALSNIGQQTGTSLGQLRQQGGSTVSGTYLTGAQQEEQALENIGAAQASGIVGSANAWSGALGGASNNLTNLMMLNRMNPYGGYGSFGGYQDSMGY